MAFDIIMPKAGMSMETGKFMRWLKKIGESVEQGDSLFEIETDKVNMVVDSDYSGYLIQTMVEEGEDVPVTQVIGYIGSLGEKILPAVNRTIDLNKNTVLVAHPEDSASPTLTVSKEPGKYAATPLAKMLSSENEISLSQIKPSGSHGEILARDVEAVKASQLSAVPAATSLARRIAIDNDVQLDTITGSGKAGKIRKDDVMASLTANTPAASPYGRIKPLTGMRKVIAQRMSKCHTEVPAVTLNTAADVTDLSALRKQLNERLKTHITYNDLIIWIAARVLRETPEVNVAVLEQGIAENSDVNIGIAVALTNGLTVPVLRHADQLGLRELSTQARNLADKARQGGLMPDDYTGGSFTISNIGMFGVTSFNPIINQPESMILGVCAITPQLVMNDDGTIVKRMMMGLSLTFDHRAFDGVQAAAFLKRIVTLMENPFEMMT